MRRFRLICVWAALGPLCASVLPTGAAPPPKPNVLIILTDDLGFSDIGCYGSEIATPNLDRLAMNGLRFSQFYNTAKCHSSRASLLTGRWCEQAGGVSLTRATTIAEVLAPAGYFTAMTGKWHLSKQPTDFGFQRYWGHLSGASSYFHGNETFRLNGKPWTVPDKGFYTTVANVDYALKFLGEARETKKPWFLYVAFNAPHAPLQPLEADYKKYLGKYDIGWDVMRAARAAKQKQLGIIGSDVEPSPRPDHVPAWDSLPEATRTWEARRMAAYAGMIDRVDQELGRLFGDLERSGEMNNTLILFFSDNGACPYDRRSVGPTLEPYNPQSHWSDSTGWAWARNTPFRYYKQNQFEGGIATPAIIYWPTGLKIKPGALESFPAHLVDVMPTLVELCGTTWPTNWPGRQLTPLAGISLKPILEGGTITSRPPIHLLFSRDRGLRDGDWKLVSFQSDPWELYNIAQDRTEAHNLAAQHSDIVKRMAQQWSDMADHILRLPARQRGPVAAVAAEPRRHNQWTDYSSPDASSSRRAVARKEARAKRAAKAPSEAAPAPTPAQFQRVNHAAVPGVRPRVNTKLTVQNGQLVLQCAGNDPGLAFDRLPSLSAVGPYTLVFRLKSRAAGQGDLYWTTDADTALTRGRHLAFKVEHDGQWQTVKLEIPEPKALHGIRLDPCSGPGEVRIEGLQLKDYTGKTLKSWP